MSLPLQERALSVEPASIVRMTLADLGQPFEPATVVTSLIPNRPLEPGEQYRFHFNMTKCIGCRSCEVACNEQNGNPADIRWRRIGEIEGGAYPNTQRHYLSMGCNHCLDADCVKGCPVDAYTKDPVTGIVLHSADACIGCQYCVWNCPYSVPQFNPERGVVGKCDMCHGRLTDGLEPACVNACPEAAIEIEIVDTTAWRVDYSAAESPGMPAAGHTISTTRITLPPNSATTLERVDSGRIRPEHAHSSLVFMTTLIQAVTGSLIFSLTCNAAHPPLLTMLLFVTIIALTISIFHLGRPLYAWRALKMWRRSWLSREVLCFGLFFVSLTVFTIASWLMALPSAITTAIHASWLQQIDALPYATQALAVLGWLAAFFGVAGTIASAFIYLVPARPAWNMIHTPIDFVLSGALIGSILPLSLCWIAQHLAQLRILHSLELSPSVNGLPIWPAVAVATLWIANHATRLVRLNLSSLFEERATAQLLNTKDLRPAVIGSFGLALATGVLAFCGAFAYATLAAFAAVLLVRYLFILNTGRTVEHWHTRTATLTGSVTRVLGGWFADRIGGITTLSVVFLIAIAGLFGLTTTPSLLVTTLLFMLCFAALGAGNGAIFQLVPLRWPITTAVAGGMIGEIGALGGSILPNILGQSRQRTGSYAAGFVIYAALTLSILILLRIVSKRWTSTWVGAGGRALKEDEQLVTAGN